MTTTRNPSPASSDAVAAPIPRLAPVTTATRVVISLDPRDEAGDSGLDDGVEPDESYVYRVEYEAEGGSILLFQTESIATPAIPLALEQNVPNPFNPATEISYYLPEAMDVRLEIYNISGRRVAVLADGRQPKGWQAVHWGGVDAGGRQVASGIYFYRLRAGKEVISKKMVLLR